MPLWLLVLPLPLSAAVNLLVKRPILLALGAAAGVNTVGPTSPLWFIVAPDHEIPEVEVVVERHDRFRVVEKTAAEEVVADYG